MNNLTVEWEKKSLKIYLSTLPVESLVRFYNRIPCTCTLSREMGSHSLVNGSEVVCFFCGTPKEVK